MEPASTLSPLRWPDGASLARRHLGVGKLINGVSGIKSSVMPLGDSLKAWGTQQVRGISDAVQQTPLFENVSSKAQIVKQHTSAATTAAMQGLKALGQGDIRPDPSPKAYVMHMYT